MTGTIDAATRLRQIIDGAKKQTGLSLADMTVLSNGRDPYRLATDSHRFNAAWLADSIARIGLMRPIHLRGLHYRLIGSVSLPNGVPYVNSDDCWMFLSERAAIAARFLGTVDFDRFVDNRNEAPSIYTPEFVRPQPTFAGQWSLELPGADEIMPELKLTGSLARQAWRLCIVGEKSGLFNLIDPIARRFNATLALPAGEISTTMVERIIADAHLDGRPLAVIYLADCDPAGHQMSISFARKAQAIIDLKFPDVRLRMHHIALTAEQSRSWNLPSTPLKATESRAEKWQLAMGIEQTEIDAAVALAPYELEREVCRACLSYFDDDLAERGRKLGAEWERAAAERLSAGLGEGALREIHRLATDRLQRAQVLIDEISAAVTINPDELLIDLPPVPKVLMGRNDGHGLPCVIDTADGFIAVTAALKGRKAYLEDAA